MLQSVRLRCAVALIALGACSIAPPKQPETLGIDPTQPGARDSVLALGRRQAYDENIGAAARGILENNTDVTIEPMDDAYLADSVSLATGVVIARLINHGKDALPRLGLAPGAATFWLVYQRDGQLVSDFIADTRESQYDRTGVPTDRHEPTRAWRQSISQWQLPGPVAGMGAGVPHLLVESGSQPWTVCGSQGCCKPHN